jgi:hypothetical protein
VLPLVAEEWKPLRHAYGAADDLPPLLEQLASFPKSGGNAEPWFSLWSMLYHQGDVYPASFAAVPHIVATLASAPSRAGFDYFLLPASVEVARCLKRVSVPPALTAPYRDALLQLPTLAGTILRPGVDPVLSQSALAAAAAGAGDCAAAHLLLETDRADFGRILEWYRSQ